MTREDPLTVGQGRAMQARARRYLVVEKVGLFMAGAAILLFAGSIVELRRIDASVLAGGAKTVPYFAYAAILLFVSGFAVFKIARHVVADISRALESEQRRRDADDPRGDDAAEAVPPVRRRAAPPLEGR